MNQESEKNSTAKAWEALMSKIAELLANGSTYDAIAEDVGTNKTVVWNWVNKGKGGKRVSFEAMSQYLRGVGLNPSDYFDVPTPSEAPWSSNTPGGVPLLGLASCGVEGWYNKSQLGMKAPRPGDQWQNDELFAVMAYGSSLEPKGIESGFICYCDPHAQVDEGDIVFVERNDETVTLKQFTGTQGQWSLFRGWLEANRDGIQKSFTIKELTSSLKRVVPVTYLKIKM